jgi:hypothetical protein
MPDARMENALLSRRGVMKVGLVASTLLATAGLTASLSGCSSSRPRLWLCGPAQQ